MTPPLLMRRTLKGFEPANQAALNAMNKVQFNDVVKVEVKRPRSLPWHRRYWALVSLVADNSSYTAEEVHILLKLRAGCKKAVQERNGTVHWYPDSVAFDRMDRDQWSAYWERVVAYVASELLPGVKREDLEQEIAEIAGIV